MNKRSTTTTLSHAYATRQNHGMRKNGRLMTRSVQPPIRVAIVEDEARLRESLESLLNHSPEFHCVGSFGDGQAALEGLVEVKPDVVLMDIELPKIKGIECVRRLIPVLPSVPVLIFTMFADDELVFDALEAGAVGYLLKRASPEFVLEAIRDVHTGGAPMTSTIARKVVQQFHKHSRNPSKGILSPREVELLEHLAKGRAYKEAAAFMGVSIDTVRTYVRRIYHKLHVNSRQAALRKWKLDNPE